MSTAPTYPNPHAHLKLDLAIQTAEHNIECYILREKVSLYALPFFSLLSLFLLLVYVPRMAPLALVAEVLSFKPAQNYLRKRYQRYTLSEKEHARVAQGIKSYQAEQNPRGLLKAQAIFWKVEQSQYESSRKDRLDRLDRYETNIGIPDLSTHQKDKILLELFKVEVAYFNRLIEASKVKSLFFELLVEHPDFTKSLQETLDFAEGPLSKVEGPIAFPKGKQSSPLTIYAQEPPDQIKRKLIQILRPLIKANKAWLF